MPNCTFHAEISFLLFILLVLFLSR